MMNYRRTLLMLPLLMAAVSVNAAESGASQALLKGTMSVGAANNLYKNSFVFSSPPSPNAIVSKVFWQYSLSQRQVPQGGILQVYLCQSTPNDCIDISSTQNGSTSFFSGRAAQLPFFLYYRVSGRVAMRYTQGAGDTQLMVNWDVK
ncbi:flagellar protein FlhE [Erwinia sp. V71]|uniref:flagellar protein FlhE n=1 Tax=Erwinia sp. V71 TaxID=3369424 RepID=UPI003F600304